MVQEYDYIHLEPKDGSIQYIVRYPHDPHNLEFILRLEDIAKRYLRGNTKEIKVLFGGYQGSNSMRFGPGGSLWRGPKGEVYWGSSSHSHYSIIDRKSHRLITVKEYDYKRRL